MKHLPADFVPPFRVHVETRPNKRDAIHAMWHAMVAAAPKPAERSD